MKNITENRKELIAALQSLSEDQRSESLAGMDGAYNPHVLRLTKEWGLRESDGRVRGVEEEIAYQSKLTLDITQTAPAGQNSADILLKISERGNGLPSAGAMVYDSESDTVYELTADYPGGCIHTGGLGEGNHCYMYAREIGAASDITDEEFDDLPQVAVEIAARRNR